jgi:hypothetical protein
MAVRKTNEVCRLQTDLPDGSFSATPVKPLFEKYFCFSEVQISSIYSPSRSDRRGARDRHDVERDAMDAEACADERG